MRAHVPPTRSFAGFLAAALGALMLVAAPAGAADDPNNALSKDEQKCVVEINKNVAKVAKAQGKRICKCIKNGAKGKLAPGETIEDCVSAASPKVITKVIKATTKLKTKVGDKCANLSPGFGVSSAGIDPNALSAAAIATEASLIHWIFGSDLDAVILPKKDPNDPAVKPTSKCQIDVAKAAKKCFDAKWKVFIKCKKNGLKGKVPPGPIDSADDLETLCLQDPNEDTGQPDPKGKIAKACVTKLNAKIQKKCIDKGADLARAFPLFDPNADDLRTFVDRMVECEFCLLVNATDGLERDCDLFDDGLANGSCVNEPQAAICDPDPFLEAGEDRIRRSTARLSVLIPALGPNPVTLKLKGPAVIQRGDPSDPGDGRRTIPTEMVSMSLTGSPGITLRVNPDLPSVGEIRASQPGSDFPADSFFDVFFEIEVGGTGGLLLHNGPNDPVRMEAKLRCLPPYGRVYLPATTLATPLLDTNGNQIGTLTHASHQIDPVLDHFKLYELQEVGVSLDGPLVTLDDQFGQRTVDLGRAEFILPPVSKDGENIFRPSDHLVCYDIPNQTFGPVNVEIDNQFGKQQIIVENPETLCVPTEKAIPPLNFASLPLKIDHYECYRANGVPPRLDPNSPIIVDLRDQFELEPSIEIGPPLLFCNPVKKTTADGISFPIRNPAGHLTCYELIPGAQFGPLGVAIRNQFHPNGAPASVNQSLMLCVPGAKGDVTPIIDPGCDRDPLTGQCGGSCPTPGDQCVDTGNTCECLSPPEPCELSEAPICGGACDLGQVCLEAGPGQCTCIPDAQQCELSQPGQCGGVCPYPSTCTDTGNLCRCISPLCEGSPSGQGLCGGACPQNFTCDDSVFPALPCVCYPTFACGDPIDATCDGFCPVGRSCFSSPLQGCLCI